MTAVPTASINDPMDICDPQGFPRVVLHNFRTSQIVQTPNQVLILYEFNKKWRVIPTHGRPLPKDPEPRVGMLGGQMGGRSTFVAQNGGARSPAHGSIMPDARTATRCAWKKKNTSVWTKIT